MKPIEIAINGVGIDVTNPKENGNLAKILVQVGSFETYLYNVKAGETRTLNLGGKVTAHGYPTDGGINPELSNEKNLDNG